MNYSQPLETDPKNLKKIGPGRILGIDYGRKRIGLAMSDPSQMMASTLKTVSDVNRDRVIEEISVTIEEHNISAIVLGKPLHMSGEKGEMVQEVENFANELGNSMNIPIFLWDERWTTARAERLLIETGHSPSKSRDKIDQLSAAYLLQNFLDRLAFIKNNRPYE